MSDEIRVADAGAVFENRFGAAPLITARAPGRVNLVGEHTDYNGGFVLPIPLDLEISVAIDRAGRPGEIEVYSRNLDATETRGIGEPATGAWSDYILGCFHLAGVETGDGPGFRLAIDSTLPMGAGISSSAALEVATLRALNDLRDIVVGAADLAAMAQKVEREFVGMPCGIMDQFTASAGTRGQALFLDTQTLEFQLVPLLLGYDLVTVHSGITHKLTEDGYATRVTECAAACAALKVESLRDVNMDDLARIDAIAAPANRRARHIVTENQRVLDGVKALKAGEAEVFGALMVESHLSQRNDYEVSVPEIDQLVEHALERGAMGARLTGGGFGGSIVALVKSELTETWCESMTGRFEAIKILAVT